jgi:hypothetical protein
MATYVRYRIDASLDLGSDRLHTAAVEQEWHDTEDEAIAYARDLLEADPDLILSVGEYHITQDEEPTDHDWAYLRRRAPLRETEVR